MSTLPGSPSSPASKRIVLKFGSGILTKIQTPEPDPVQLRKLVEAVALLKQAGHQVIVVSSGAVASGLKPLEMNQRPQDLTSLQALAAVGQTHLMHSYEGLLRDHSLHVAQLLVTHEDLAEENRASRVQATLERLLDFPQIVPVINENDSVAIEELRFGDNDKLSARISGLCRADLLILLTSAPGLLKDIRHPEEGPIPFVDDVEAVIHHAQEEKTQLGSGGMISKLRAVQEALAAGVQCIIANGRKPEQLVDIVNGQGICTRFILKSNQTAAQ
jgi:glutamate 5-kinase